MAKLNSPIRLWVSRGIIAAGVVWIVVIFFGEAADLTDNLVVESYAWLGFTIVAGCVALLITVPIFRSMLAIHTGSHLSLGLVARLFFVAQIGRPQIATPVGDLPSLFQQHEFGILAVAPSVVAFIDALQKALMTHPSRFQSELVVLAEEFDIEAIGERFAIGLFA